MIEKYLTEEMYDGWIILDAAIDYECECKCDGCGDDDELFLFQIENENGEKLVVCQECVEVYVDETELIDKLNSMMEHLFDRRDNHLDYMQWSRPVSVNFLVEAYLARVNYFRYSISEQVQNEWILKFEEKQCPPDKKRSCRKWVMIKPRKQFKTKMEAMLHAYDDSTRNILREIIKDYSVKQLKKD